jgi:prepilin-type N-terminal cleavage/methylation domain-containing protein
MMVRKGLTLVELIIVVLVIGVLAAISVPRLNYAAIQRQDVRGTAAELVANIRKTRSIAITHAVESPNGYAWIISNGAYGIYPLNAGGQPGLAIETSEVNENISCSDAVFKFTPLGTLILDSDSGLTVSGQGISFNITLIPATGMVEWQGL